MIQIFFHQTELFSLWEDSWGVIWIKTYDQKVFRFYRRTELETADFMASFATYDSDKNRYNLVGINPAQETLSPEVTYNSPYELAYWHYGPNVPSSGVSVLA